MGEKTGGTNPLSPATTDEFPKQLSGDFAMLTDAKCRSAMCPLDKKQARFTDSGGMYLQVSPAGSKRWFLKYRVAGVEKQLALGS